KADRERRPDEGGRTFPTARSKVIAPTRLPRRAKSTEAATTRSAAASRFRQSEVPQSRDRLVSTRSQASSPRSGCASLTKVRPERAERLQSIWRGSSPGTYSRASAYSRPAPSPRERSSPDGCTPSRRMTGQRSAPSRYSMGGALGPSGLRSGMAVPHVQLRWRVPLQQSGHDVLSRDAGRDAFIAEEQPVPDHLRRHV